MTKRKLKNFDKPKKAGETATDILEEGFHLLRMNAFRLLPVYYLGVFPFAISLLYFINDMSLGHPVEHEIINSVLILTALFAWKNLFQSVFCLRAMNILNCKEDERLTARKLLRIFIFQNIVQPAGLIAQTVSAFLIFPVGFTTAFFNSFAVLASTNEDSFAKSFKDSWKLAFLKPRQNHFMLLALFFFSIMVALNIAIAIFFVPQLLKSFLGVDSAFSVAGDMLLALRMVFNTTFWSIVLILAWLFVDPILKAAFAIRVFYGESASRGYDLLAELARISSRGAKLCLLLGLFLFCVSARGESDGTAASNKTPPSELKKAIEKTLSQREYKWRLPPIDKAETAKSNFIAEMLEAFVKKTANFIRSGIDLLEKFFPKSRHDSGSISGLFKFIKQHGVWLLLVMILLVALVCALMLLRIRRNMLANRALLEAVKPETLPDLNDENVSAADLKEDGWIKIASELSADGQLRLALRAVFLATLSMLSDKRLLTIARFKTNREYFIELKRRAHSDKELLSLFSENILVFERAWYGDHEVTMEIYEKFKNNYEKMNKRTEQ